jgi:hypothetical protein
MLILGGEAQAGKKRNGSGAQPSRTAFGSRPRYSRHMRQVRIAIGTALGGRAEAGVMLHDHQPAWHAIVKDLAART